MQAAKQTTMTEVIAVVVTVVAVEAVAVAVVGPVSIVTKRVTWLETARLPALTGVVAVEEAVPAPASTAMRRATWQENALPGPAIEAVEEVVVAEVELASSATRKVTSPEIVLTQRLEAMLTSGLAEKMTMAATLDLLTITTEATMKTLEADGAAVELQQKVTASGAAAETPKAAPGELERL